MKTNLVFSFILCCFFFNSHAQYKQNKQHYNYKDYFFQKADKYNPTIAGVASFVLPGLGQATSGEITRGATFFGVYALFTTQMLIGAYKIVEYIDENPIYQEGDRIDGLGQFTLGVLGSIVTTIWSTSDAVRVAKINNLAFRDKITKTSFKLEPKFFNLQGDNKIAAGLQLKIRID